MKQIIHKVGMIAAMMLSFLSVSAYDFEVDGIRYEVLSLDDMTCRVIAKSEKYIGCISIPASVTFNGKSFNIVEISDRAFLNCGDITELNLQEAQKLQKIGVSAFEGCSSISEVVIPSACKALGHSAFLGCTSLTSVIICESSDPLVLYPKDVCGASYRGNLQYYFGQFAHCPIKRLKILRDLQYGGWATEFQEIETHIIINNTEGKYMNVYCYPWINSCSENLTIGKMVTVIPYNLLLTLNPVNFILEDGEMPLNVEPLTTYKSYSYAPDVYGEYSINDDGYILIKESVNYVSGTSVYGLFWGFNFSNCNYTYWGRPIKTKNFTYRKGGSSTSKSISLKTSMLTTFEYGKTLVNIGDVNSVSGSNLTNIIWNDIIESCSIFGTTPQILELRFPDSVEKISGFSSTGTLKDLFFGAGLQSLSGFSQSAATDIHVKAEIPPILSEYAFNDSIFIESTLHVPNGCKEAYSSSDVWKRFWNIVEDENASIDVIHYDNNRPCFLVENHGIRALNDIFVQIYNIEGTTIANYCLKNGDHCYLPTGIVIIKIGDKTFKIVI